MISITDSAIQHRLNIALVSDHSYPYTKGGVETRYYTLARYLVSRGHRVTWFTSKEWEGAGEHKVEGIRMLGICPAYRAYNKKGKRTQTQALLFGLAAFKMLAMPDQFDVIDLSQYPLFHLFGGELYSLVRRTPVVVSWYEFWGDQWLEYLGHQIGKVGQWVEQCTARLAGNIIVISEQSLKRLVEIGCNPGSIHYVPNWINYEHIVGLAPIGSPYEVCYFGRLKDHKNVDLLLKAVALCRDESLVLRTKVLGDGPERQRLEKLGQELGLGSQVDFLGRIDRYDDLLGYVKSAQLFVNPSTKEGGGSVVCLEANACGVPILAVRHPLGLDESLIVEGQTGYWATEVTSRALADKLHEYFQSDVKHRERMKQEAVEWASRYSVENLCHQIETIYLGLISERISS